MRIQPARSLLRPLLEQPFLAFAISIAVLATVVTASSASATSSFHGCCGDRLPGIPLADLLDPELDLSFESGDERLTFGNFSAEASGITPRKLRRYRVLPTEDGFKLLSPMHSFSGRDSELELRYDVVVADGFGIEAMKLSAFGAAAGRGATAGVEALLASGGTEVGALDAVLQGPLAFGRASDELSFDDLLAHIALSEAIGAHSEHENCFHFGFAKILGTRRSFSTTIAEVPEPATLTMLSLGFAGVALWRRGRDRS